MTHEHEDPKFNEWLRKQAEAYHSPRPTPREEMWARIAGERKRREQHVIVLRPWMRWGLAAAAMLALGIGIGRWSANQQPGGAPVTPIAATVDSTSTNVVYQMAATQYLSRAETFLTGFRSDVRGTPASNGRFVRQARDLLNTTQLLLDSPAAEDPRMRSLLEDLELVLAQISQLSSGQGARDADLVTQSMDQSNVLPKLRSAIPAGPVPVRTEGAL
jgi:hypothetical protein